MKIIKIKKLTKNKQALISNFKLGKITPFKIKNKILKIKNKKIKIKMCESLFSKMLGLMFTAPIIKDNALLFCFKSESRIGRSIHMFFVFYPIKVFWLDKNYIVVDSALAKPFRPYYTCKKPSKYILETNKEINIKTGKKLKMK
jgi:uncharacterized membrane protein (UPF0127 family)